MVIELTFFLEMATEKPFDGPSLTYLRCCEFSLLKETLCTPHPSTRLLIFLLYYKVPVRRESSAVLTPLLLPLSLSPSPTRTPVSLLRLFLN